MKVLKALDIAKYIVTKCVKDGCPINNVRLNEILYWIRVKSTLSGCTMFYEAIDVPQLHEEPEDGFPKCLPVYYHFCGWGIMPIQLTYEDVEIPYENEEFINGIVESKRSLEIWESAAEIKKYLSNGR